MRYRSEKVFGTAQSQETLRSGGDADAGNDTDNVMDYFFDFDDKKRKLIWKWQMKKVYGTDNDGRLIKK